MKPTSITFSCDSAFGGQTSVHSGVSNRVHAAFTHALGSPKRAVHSLLVLHPSRSLVSTITLQLEEASAHTPHASSQQRIRSRVRGVALDLPAAINDPLLKMRLSD
jgi:hypothetical protein